jgi:FAD/FMN-containing dehydrogenase
VNRRDVPGKLRDVLRGQVLGQREAGFAAAAHVFNPRFDDIRPVAVARPVDARDVRDAIRFAVEHGLPLRARSGGHSYAGYSTLSDGIVLDLRRLNSIRFNPQTDQATIGAGAQLIDINAELDKAGRTIPTGSCPSVGVAGVTLGGGFGLESRRFGLTCDSLVAVEIVTADGKLWTVDAHSDPELLWALKGGGGGNFGVVTFFTFKTHRVPANVSYFKVSWPWDSAAEAINTWQAWAPHAVDELTSILHLNAGSPPAIYANGQYLGPAADVPALVSPLLHVSGSELQTNVEMPWLSVQLLLADCSHLSVAECHTTGAGAAGKLERESFNAKSDYVAQPLPRAGIEAMVAAAEAPGAGALLCDSYGGAVNRVGPSDSAFYHRGALFCIQYYGAGAAANWIDQAWRKMRPFVSGHAYQNYMDPALEGWEAAYYGANLGRLAATGKRVDPHHFFHFPRAIGR